MASLTAIQYGPLAFYEYGGIGDGGPGIEYLDLVTRLMKRLELITLVHI